MFDLAVKANQSAQDYIKLSPERGSLLETLESLIYSQKELCTLVWLGLYDKDIMSIVNFAKLKEQANAISQETIASYLFGKPLKDALINEF